MSRQNTLEAKIRHILARYEETRNDDVRLQVQLIDTFGSPADILWRPDFKDSMIRISALRTFREDHVKRVRAKIQNDDGDFLPTDPDIRKKRQISEDEWSEYTRKVSRVDGGNPSFT